MNSNSLVAIDFGAIIFTSDSEDRYSIGLKIIRSEESGS